MEQIHTVSFRLTPQALLTLSCTWTFRVGLVRVVVPCPGVTTLPGAAPARQRLYYRLAAADAGGMNS